MLASLAISKAVNIEIGSASLPACVGASRVFGEQRPAFTTFEKIVSASRRNQHVTRARYPFDLFIVLILLRIARGHGTNRK